MASIPAANITFQLTDEEIANPFPILEDLRSNYSLQEVRDVLATTTGIILLNPDILTDEADRDGFLRITDKIGKALEVVYLIAIMYSKMPVSSEPVL